MACDPVDPVEVPIPPGPGKLTLNFVHHVDGEDFELETKTYTNAASNEYSVTRLQYYLSNFSLKGSKSDFVPDDSYHLISIINQPTLGGYFEKTTVSYDMPAGTYSQLVFHVGVDSERNSKGPYTGDLDFSWIMNWSWSGDYIFFKNEGIFDGTEGEDKYIYHLAGEENYKQIVLDLPESFELKKGENKELDVYVNINEFFENPNTIDLNIDKSTMSPGTELANALGANYANMFSLER